MTSDVEAIGHLFCQSGSCLVTAESCTGGRIASLVTRIAGASSWYLGGWVTYSKEKKNTQLGVPEEMLQAHGAVSSQVAEAMCEGARRSSGATVALSTTGIAGPDGGTGEKPVGTVFVGCAAPSGTEVMRFLFSGTREEVQEQAVVAAMQLLRKTIS